MKYYISIMLGAVLICAGCYIGEKNIVKRSVETAVEETGTVAPPSALRLKIVENGFQLNWTLSPQDPATVTGYELVRANIFSGPYETVGRVRKGVFSFVDKTAKPEAIYFYKVRAIAGDRYSPFSREAAGEISGRP